MSWEELPLAIAEDFDAVAREHLRAPRLRMVALEEPSPTRRLDRKIYRMREDARIQEQRAMFAPRAAVVFVIAPCAVGVWTACADCGRPLEMREGCTVPSACGCKSGRSFG